MINDIRNRLQKESVPHFHISGYVFYLPSRGSRKNVVRTLNQVNIRFCLEK